MYQSGILNFLTSWIHILYINIYLFLNISTVVYFCNTLLATEPACHGSMNDIYAL